MELPPAEPQPELSILVVVYNIPREARRMLVSLSARYQQHISAGEYEVLVLDNGSNPPVTPELWDGLEGNFRLIRLDDAPPSPAKIVNLGLAEARGSVIGLMIDGARLASPGLLHFARKGAGLYPRAVVATLGWYLGYDGAQRWAQAGGYDAAKEDALLDSIGWPEDGYKLFDISALDESSVDGWLAPIAESNALFMPQELWRELGGVDERFALPGGGLLDLDLFRRAATLPATELVVQLGEGTFHQLHGGVATNAPIDTYGPTIARMFAEYEAIRGEPWSYAQPARRTYLGVQPRTALSHFVRAALHPAEPRPGEAAPPLGSAFDPELWSTPVPATTDDVRKASLTLLAQAEFRAGRFAATAVIRLARSLALDDPQSLALLPYASAWYRDVVPSADKSAEVSRALGDAYALLGDAEASALHHRQAVESEAASTAAPQLQIDPTALLGMVPPAQDIFVGGQSDAAEYLHVGVLLVQFLVSYGLKPTDRILDIGCGQGRVAAPLTQYLTTGSYDGFDVVQRGIDWCREKIGATHPNFRFEWADLHNSAYNTGVSRASDFRFPYEDASFDMVLSASVFTHMLPDDVHNYLQETARVLRPGGTCFASFFLLNDGSRVQIAAGKSGITPAPEHDGYAVADEGTPEVVVFYDEAHLLAKIQQYGLVVVDRTYGDWCGRNPSSGYQDVIVLRRP